jgi:hypothetical protein
MYRMKHDRKYQPMTVLGEHCGDQQSYDVTLAHHQSRFPDANTRPRQSLTHYRDQNGNGVSLTHVDGVLTYVCTGAHEDRLVMFVGHVAGALTNGEQLDQFRAMVASGELGEH